ncbi:hypothetical protein DSO57_1039769 [Entomophthora muscae]|uniref:Uncharacterized protein n=1 Tax=Entomophthora muscae TaxID=34485 RepID=A0ACC2UFJ1_9FUNG|nr:hypothetical protein DSO57_1039769 [Entomophthora muscae]
MLDCPVSPRCFLSVKGYAAYVNLYRYIFYFFHVGFQYAMEQDSQVHQNMDPLQGRLVELEEGSGGGAQLVSAPQASANNIIKGLKLFTRTASPTFLIEL